MIAPPPRRTGFFEHYEELIGTRMRRLRNRQQAEDLAHYDLSNPKLGVGVKNVFDQQHYIRSSDNNSGLYLGEPRTFFVQASVRF
jgi:Fe(3+) dicitrate transport protein